jgi:hypothetical protein
MSEILLKLAPIAAMAIQLVVGRFGASRIRSLIKANAELLEKLPAEGEGRAKLAKHIDYLVGRLTESESRRFRRKRDAEGVMLGIIAFIGFGYWSYVLIQADEMWWTLLTGVFAAAGLTGLVEELQGKDEESESTVGSSPATSLEELVQAGASTVEPPQRQVSTVREGGSVPPVTVVSSPGRRAAAGRPQGRP